MTKTFAAPLFVLILLLPSIAFSQSCSITGTLTGSSTCNGAPGLLTFHAQTGTGPFTLTYTDGTTTWTQTDVMDGTPFKVQVQPTVPPALSGFLSAAGQMAASRSPRPYLSI